MGSSISLSNLGTAAGRDEAEDEAAAPLEKEEEEERQEPKEEGEDEENEEDEEDEEDEDAVESEAGDIVTELPKLDIPDRFRNRRRRFSVSAEVDRADDEAELVPKVIPKSEDALRRIREATRKSILFDGVDPEQEKIIFDAMEERAVAAGDVVISQGDEGDYFYVIDRGHFTVFKRLAGQTEAAHGRGDQIWEYEGAGSFGELALMYNSPRSATVVADTDGLLWRVDRQTFRSVLVNHNARQRHRYEEFLAEVPLFANVSRTERAAFADILISTVFEDGRKIVTEGEPGDVFYLIEKGTVRVTQRKGDGGEEVEVDRLTPGRFFGEAALLSNEPRNATVVADGNVRVAAMGRTAYEALVGRVYIN